MNRKSKPARLVVDDFLKELFLNKEANATELIYTKGRFYQWFCGCYDELTDDELKTIFTKWAYTLKKFDNTKRNADEALHHIKAKCGIPDLVKNTYINKTSGYCLAFENGIVDMSVATSLSFFSSIQPHTPLFFNVAKIPYSFDTEKENCPTWLNIIDQILPDKIDKIILQEWFGYHFLPGLTRSKMMFFEGAGANGKSVVLLVLRLLLGETNVSSIPLSAFDFDKPFKLAATDGKLANICEEGGQITARIEETLKQFINGGVFSVERKFKDPFNMTPTAKLTVATNEFPHIKDKTDGFWRRILYIRYKVTISPVNQKSEYLEKDFWLNSGELTGILNWALKGAIRLNENKRFSSSDFKQEEMLRLKVNSDLARSWVADRMIVANGHQQPTNEILQALKFDIERGLLPHISQREVFKEIESQFPNAKRPANAVLIKGQRVRVIVGVRFIPTHITQEISN